MIEFWKNIPGYDGKYQVNTEGDIRLIFPSGKTRLLKPFKRNKRDHKYYVILRKDGKKYLKSVLYVVSRTFLGEPPKGYVAYYKNECYREGHLNNIGYIKKVDLGITTGKKRRKTVCKIDKNGDIVDYYGSAKEAAEANYFTQSMMCYICRGNIKSLFSSDGYAYAYDEDEHAVKMLIRKIKKVNRHD